MSSSSSICKPCCSDRPQELHPKIPVGWDPQCALMAYVLWHYRHVFKFPDSGTFPILLLVAILGTQPGDGSVLGGAGSLGYVLHPSSDFVLERFSEVAKVWGLLD